jgi:DNA-binding response OmpR family regulator
VVTKKRILVVDDEQINLEFFDVMLSKLGFDVRKAENGQEALDAVRKLRPDLVILDNIMPRLSGWEVTKILKTSPEYAEFSDTPIIMFSALDDVKDKVEGLELGADDYITKPFNFAEVLARIRAILRSRELAGQMENREKRIVLGDKTIDELASVAAKLKKSFEDILCAPDLESAKALATDASAALEALDHRFESLKIESNSLRNEAHELALGHRTTR